MSVESEILRIQHNIADTYATVSSKGGDVPLQPNSANLAAAVASIPAGGSAVLVKSPVGTIVIWSGTADNIPAGWQLCDGTNGTPDLRDKFVLGAGTSHAVGETGGSEEVTLTKAQMPEHDHAIGVYVNTGGTTSNDFRVYSSLSSRILKRTEISGSSQPHPNMPPYYALCYIMKLTADETDTPDIFVDETLTKSPTNELSVTTPVQGIFTQAEYGALPEDKQAKGLYVVQEEGDDAGGSGGSSGTNDIYNTEETRIGTWIDGKPLYRVVMEAVLPTDNSWHNVSPGIRNVDTVTSLTGVAHHPTRTQTFYPLPMAIPGTGSVILFAYYRDGYSDAYGSQGLNAYCTYSEFKGGTVKMTMEYTKTTD